MLPVLPFIIGGVVGTVAGVALKKYYDEIKKLGEENFFHKNYEATLAPVYGSAVNPDDLVVEGGEVKK